MRSLLILGLLAALVHAGDLVHLRNGRTLQGTVVAESEREVVLDLGSGRMVLPRKSIRLIERGARPTEPRRLVTERDEWFLVLHRDKVAGWRRVVETVGPQRVTVEERTVFFRPGGGDDVDIRRVETADRAGRPREFLLMETYGRRMELTSGQVARGGRWTIQVTRDGKTEAHDLEAEDGWVLALPAWSRFLASAKPGEARKIRALDLRRLHVREFLLQRDADAVPDGRPCRSLRLVGNFRRARALYRPGEGSLAVELNGATLVAKRSTSERVALARRAHAAPRPLQIEEAQRFPFYRRPKELKALFPRAGISLTAPDAGWMRAEVEPGKGQVCSFEKLGLFASLEVFVYPAAGDVEACLERALARLRLTAQSIKTLGPARAHRLAGQEARTVLIRARHRGEELHCRLTVVCAPDRYLTIVGACPERWWKFAEDDFEKFVGTLEIVR